MAFVILTVKYPTNQQIDLMLPDNVPCQFLTDALFEILDLPSSIKPPVTFKVGADTKEAKVIPPESTLAEAGILCGSYLHLVTSKIVTKPEIYLVAGNGNKYILHQTTLIGRNDFSAQIRVDIDLSQLSRRRVVSRQHAVIKLAKDNHYILEDLSKRGTWVNGRRVDEETTLENGDVIDFGPPGEGGRLTFVELNPSESRTKKTEEKSVQESEPKPREMQTGPLLEITQPSLVSEYADIYPITRTPFTIGRPDKRQAPDLDLTRLESSVEKPISSRSHCMVLERNGIFELYAHDTANGTYVNGVELAPRDYKELGNNDIIQFGYGGVQLTFRIPTSPPLTPHSQ